MQPGEGERLHKQQRARFWTLIAGLGLVGAIAGFVTGFVTDHGEGAAAYSPTVLNLAAAGVVLVAALAAYGSWKFFVSVDELEVADNLWGSLVGFYTYALLFPAWWALAQLGHTAEPDHWVIYGVSMITAAAFYLLRKWRLR